MCTHVQMCTYAYIHVCTHVYIHVCGRMPMYIHTSTCTHACTSTSPGAYACPCTCGCTKRGLLVGNCAQADTKYARVHIHEHEHVRKVELIQHAEHILEVVREQVQDTIDNAEPVVNVVLVAEVLCDDRANEYIVDLVVKANSFKMPL